MSTVVDDSKEKKPSISDAVGQIEIVYRMLTAELRKSADIDSLDSLDMFDYYAEDALSKAEELALEIFTDVHDIRLDYTRWRLKTI